MKKAFTLIELLVVIAIIAILAAILFPVFAQAKVAAKKTTSLSNVKQQGTAIQIYASDADDVFPLLFTATDAPVLDGLGANTYTWQNTVQPYMKSYGLLIDPLHRLNKADPINYLDPFLNYGIPPRAGVSGTASFWTDSYYIRGGFGSSPQIRWDGVGGFMAGNNWATPGASSAGVGSLPLTAVARPAEQILVSQAAAPDWWSGYFNDITSDTFWYCVSWYADYGLQRFGPAFRYGQTTKTECGSMRLRGGQTIAVFTDGHAAATSQGKMFERMPIAGGEQAYKMLWPTE